MRQDVANSEPPRKDDLMKTIEAWIIERYDLNEYERWSEWGSSEQESKSLEPDEVPNYITRLLPWLFYEFTGGWRIML